MKTIEEVYSEAIDLLQTNGWCRGINRNKQGHFCAQGALIYVLSNNRTHYFSELNNRERNVFYIVEKLLRKEISSLIEQPSHYSTITAWNDNIARDKRHVVQTFQRIFKKISTNHKG